MRFYDVECRLYSAEVWVKEMALPCSENIRQATQTILSKSGEVVILQSITPDCKIDEPKVPLGRDKIVQVESLETHFIMFLENDHSVEAAIREFNSLSGLKFEFYCSEELSFETGTSNFTDGDREYLSRNMESKIREKFKLSLRGRDFIRYSESFMRKCKGQTPEELKKKTYDKVGLVEDFNTEIDRIFDESNTKKKVYGNPVQYMVESSRLGTSVDIAEGLAESLICAGRVDLERVTTVTAVCTSSGGEFNGLSTLYKASKGGIVLLNLYLFEIEETEYASAYRAYVSRMCSFIRQYKNDVLTIVNFINTADKIKQWIYEELPDISFVEITETSMDASEATAMLKNLAKKQKVRTNKALLSQIDETDKRYARSEVDKIFDTWFDNEMKTKYYPAYKNVSLSSTKVLAKEAKGDAYKELDEMIGLTEAKGVINDALNFYKAQKAFADRGLSQNKPSMHMVFTGNPGSAKTSVARLFSQILADNEILSSGHLVECGRADLVGKYVGWTAKQVKDKFKEARGGVLFIDEAYSLVDNKSGSFGDEAINTIVQEMENMRNEVVVIFAGYPKEMEKFLEKNPGLNSRIAFHVNFDDYDATELYDITELMAKKQDITLDQDVKDKLLTIYKKAAQKDDFGNGRFARNMLERAQMRQATRLVQLGMDNVKDEDLKCLIAADFEPPQTLTTQSIAIGF